METIILYLGKSMVVSGVLTTWYLFALRGKPLHQYNRFFLLSTLLASLTIPLFHFELFSISPTISDSVAPVAKMMYSANSLGNNTIATPPTDATEWNLPMIAAAMIGTISLILLLVLLLRVLTIRKMCLQNPATEQDGVRLILTDSPKAPFAFLRYLFWNKSVPLQEEAGQLILRHELTHIQQGHTYDKLGCQMITCLFWFNPFYWIVQKELDMVHEFIADEQAVANRDPEAFALMLLRTYSNGSYLVPEHHFFSSTVRRRLTMLQNGGKPSYAKLRRFMALPLVAATFLLLSFGVDSNTTSEIWAKEKIVVLLDDGNPSENISKIYGKRIKKMAGNYNVEVRLTSEEQQGTPTKKVPTSAKKGQPDVFIAIQEEATPMQDESKGDYDIYVAGGNKYTLQSNNYSSAIFEAMVQNRVIPGIKSKGGHVHNATCGCSNTPLPVSMNKENSRATTLTEKERAYVLASAMMPGLVMVVGNTNDKVAKQQIANGQQLNELCDAILKGIVAGARKKDAPASEAQECKPAEVIVPTWITRDTFGVAKCK